MGKGGARGKEAVPAVAAGGCRVTGCGGGLAAAVVGGE